MRVVLLSPSKIKPYDKNPRRNDEAVEAVAKSIQEFGFRQPVVVDEERVIVVGHARWKAAQKLRLKQIPVHVAAGLSPAQIRAYRIADNQTNNLSSWDDGLLVEELLALQGMEYELDFLGFSADELQRIMNPDGAEGLCDPDEIPEPMEDPVSCHGDLWELGEHRLLCGDSGNPADLDRLLNGQSIQLVNMDPPYNVSVEPRSKNAMALERRDKKRPEKPDGKQRKLRAKDRPLKNDGVSPEEFGKLLQAWFGNASRVLEPGGGFYIWGGYANCGNYPPVLAANGLYFSQAIIWVKEHPVMTRKDYMGNHEWCFYGWKEGGPHRFLGPKNSTDVWSVKKVSPQRMQHLTEKPVELATRALLNSTETGENVLDLFGGSGSTLIAAQMHGRRAFLMELDLPYCDVIVQRWEKFTGQKAKRVAAKSK